MHIKQVAARAFKRFTELTITDIPETTKLVVMTGPNGGGKSSLFDAFRLWHGMHGSRFNWDNSYYPKHGVSPLSQSDLVTIVFHESSPDTEDGRRKLFYVRSAYRNEADFQSSELRRMNSPLEYPRISRLIDTDASVSENYQRIVSATIAGIYSGSFDNSTVQEFRDYYIGQVRESMRRVFDSLLLRSPGDPLQAGTFLFEKGVSRDFPYKNLSGGEKAAFDLLLDLIMKRLVYDDTVFCIDEPDLHMHTRLQARLLAELYSLIPDNCQLWLATHSIGMMKESRDLQARNPESVAFLDFHNLDLDQPVTLRPVRANRQFWLTNLDVALGDMASLLAPRRVILCEGQLASAGTSAKAEFDAKCYRTIFGHEYPDVDFLSIGSSNDVEIDKLGLGAAIQTLVPGTEVIRLVDRDDRSPQEIVDLLGKGVRVLSRRHIEAYLLDDEVITKLCEVQAKSDKLQDALNARQVAIADSVTSGKPDDDIKSAAGPLTVSLKKLLQLTGAGNTQDAFLRDTMAPLVPQCPGVYNALKRDVFGD